MALKLISNYSRNLLFTRTKMIGARSSSHFTYVPDKKDTTNGSTIQLNMFQAINNALDISLATDDSSLIFGEDVAFGGVFRCTMNLQVWLGKKFEKGQFLIVFVFRF